MILVIDGSYRKDGFTEKVTVMLRGEMEALGVEVEVIRLRDTPIEFCLNCRKCTQQRGDKPGECVHNDGMKDLIQKIEKADGYILASPTNFGSVTALFKRFLERLVVYAYWPWGTAAPKLRKAESKKKKAILVSSSAAPAFMARISYTSLRQLKNTSKTIGAEPIGIISTGMIAGNGEPKLPQRTVRKIRAMSETLVNHINNDKLVKT